MFLKKVLLTVLGDIIKITEKIPGSFYQKNYPKYLRMKGIDISVDLLGHGQEYIAPSAYFDGADYSMIHVGGGTTISRDVIILTHDYSIAKGLSYKFGSGAETVKKFQKEVRIGNNCFIGARSIILPGTVIEDNTIVGAGSVVKGCHAGNSVICGNPAREVDSIENWINLHLEKKDFE
ncbi:MAG: DapH/DapD/GlmU-related protein [Eubacteriales bacterium]|nr:DapH/DapD/GlmU-related protein [Eubacteriales bacterium]